MSRAAEQVFTEQGEIEPMWILEDTAGEQTMLVTPIVAGFGLEALAIKEKLTADLRQKFREWNVCRYASAMESWTTPATTADPAAAAEAYAAMGFTLKNAADRRERVTLQAEDDKQFLAASREIHRPQGSKPYLGALRMW